MKTSIFKINIIAVTLFTLSVGSAIAQVVSYDFYTFRLNNMFNTNAAYAGHDDGVNVFLNAQSQNNGVAFANKNFSGGVYSKLSEKQAIGGKIISDTRGAFQVLKADLSYAYILKLSEDQKLSFGVNMGVLNTNLVTSRIEGFERLDASDEMLYSPYFNTLQFTAGAGLLYTFKGLEVGVSAPSLVSTNEDAFSYMNGAIFYKFKLNKNFTMTPWVSYQNIPITKDLASLFVKSTYQNKLWLQVGYQSNNTVCAMVGFNIEQLSIGYGFRFSNNLFNTISTGSHEVSLKYQIVRNAKAETKESSNTLGTIIKELNKLIETPVTSDNREDLMSDLDKIKQALLKAEIDNSNPKKAKQVEGQLIQINEKLTELEQKFK